MTNSKENSVPCKTCISFALCNINENYKIHFPESGHICLNILRLIFSCKLIFDWYHNQEANVRNKIVTIKMMHLYKVDAVFDFKYDYDGSVSDTAYFALNHINMVPRIEPIEFLEDDDESAKISL